MLLGPGARLGRLRELLAGLGADAGWGGIDDLAELVTLASRPAVLILDADALPLEDLGFPLRALERDPGLRLRLTGSDPGSAVARRLLAKPGVAWLAWPIDVEQLAELHGPAPTVALERGVDRGPERASRDGETREQRVSSDEPLTATLPQPQHTSSQPTAARPTTSTAHGAAVRAPLSLTGIDEGLRRQVEDILGGGSGRAAEPSRPAAAVLTPRADEGARTQARESHAAGHRPAEQRGVEHRAVEQPSAERATEHGSPVARDAAPSRATTEPSEQLVPAPTPAAPWFRDQIADLADTVQRVELGHAQLRAALEGAVGGDLEERLDRLGLEFLRLVQFTRTLGYLVAPPPRGPQRIELAGQIEGQLRSARSEPDCPRFLFRAGGEAWVRSDRSLLTEAFDAVLALAQLCAGPNGTVRVEVQPGAESDIERDTVAVTIRFPAGPLASISADRVLEPYGLRRILPHLGPNSLAAARGIVEGQGGSLDLYRHPDKTLEWRAYLPGA